MKKLFSSYLLLYFLILWFSISTYAQQVPQGFRYQTTVRNAGGNLLPNQLVKIKFSLFSNAPNGTLQWQEIHSATTNGYGLVTLIIGTGTSTGMGATPSFYQINWSTGIYYLAVGIDASGGNNFIAMGNSQLFSVPYALQAMSANSSSALIGLGQFNDVDLTNIALNKTLKWNGNKWFPGDDNDRDTVSFAYNTIHTSYSDTATYVYGVPMGDTVLFAYQTQNAANSNTIGNALNTNYADTALYAIVSSPSAWTITGNSLADSSKYIGTSDNTSFTMVTNNAGRIKITTTRSITINSPTDTASLNLSGNDGMVEIGTAGVGGLVNNGSGEKLIWYPTKGAFRTGYVDTTQMDTASQGAGYNCKARKYSFSSGLLSEAIDNSLAIGRKCQANGVGNYPKGNTISLGDSCITNSARSVAIGRKNVVTIPAGGNTGVAFGYNNFVNASQAVCFGSNNLCSGTYSAIFGSYASSNNKNGCFVFSDASSSNYTNASVARQFVVRASGGVIFYTDTLATMGVQLFANGGSWSTISDRNKKQNFTMVDYENTLLKIEKLKITSWNYKTQARNIRHIGPMAQDFYKLFNVGENNISISTVDEDGVILSGIKGLINRMEILKNINEIDTLKAELNKLDNSETLNKRLDAIEASLKK